MTTASAAADLIRDGSRLEREGDFAAAAERYREALASQPLRAELWYLLGSCLRRAGPPAEALQYLEKATMLEPDNLEFDMEFASILHELRRLDEAVQVYNRIRAAHPDHVAAWSNLGIVVFEGGHTEDALMTLAHARELAPDDPVVSLNYGAVLHRLGRLDEAIERFEAARDRDSGYAEAWGNLGLAWQEKLRLEDALVAHRRAMALAPNNPGLRWNLAMTLLLSGDLPSGFEAFEARRFLPDRRPRPFPGPEWTGGPLEGKSLLVHAEQGLGDAIMFSRYLTLLAARGARIVFAVHSALASLAATVEGVAEVVAGSASPPSCDYQVPLLSLPLRLGTALGNIPATVPYLSIPPRIPSPLPARTARRRIGLVWAGNPRHGNDRNRSCSFASLSPLFDLPQIEWISLQVGDRSGDPAAAGAPVADIAPRLTDFAATAAAVNDLDLVVTVDTAVAHLAGALGRPVWLLLPYSPDWRWLTGRDDSPWYPTARLFRQSKPGDWDTVVRRVRNALL